MPIVGRFSLRATCRDAVAFLQGLPQFQSSTKIRLYFDSAELHVDDFLLSRVRHSRCKEFTFIPQ
jgi:hypothetical protein